jgi:dihydrodipicolinate synthase/N-acetylneuraminate lyase
MISQQAFHGVICPILTPFDPDGQVDVDTLRQLVDYLIDHGIRVIMPGGTTGEGMLLDLAERKVVAEAVVQQARGRAQVIVHTGCIHTADTLELTTHARSIGAAGASVITPYFFSYDDDALFEYYTTIASALPDFPIALYCFPGNAKQAISTALLRRILDRTENIVAIKLSDPNLIQLQEYIQAGGENFSTLCGVDALALPALSVGAVGQVSGNSNVFPEVFCALYEAFAAGDLQKARRQQVLINRIRAVLKDDIAHFKAAMTYRHLSVGNTRPPLRRLNARETEDLQRGLQTLGIE